MRQTFEMGGGDITAAKKKKKEEVSHYKIQHLSRILFIKLFRLFLPFSLPSSIFRALIPRMRSKNTWKGAPNRWLMFRRDRDLQRDAGHGWNEICAPCPRWLGFWRTFPRSWRPTDRHGLWLPLLPPASGPPDRTYFRPAGRARSRPPLLGGSALYDTHTRGYSAFGVRLWTKGSFSDHTGVRWSDRRVQKKNRLKRERESMHISHSSP